MERKRQDDRTRLLLADSKYTPSRTCTRCGFPTRTAGMVCLTCLDKQYFAEEMAYTREWLREHPRQEIEVGNDKQGLAHLCLLRDAVRNMAWCGVKVTQMRSKRKKVPPKDFPEELCPACRAAHEGMTK